MNNLNLSCWRINPHIMRYFEFFLNYLQIIHKFYELFFNFTNFSWIFFSSLVRLRYQVQTQYIILNYFQIIFKLFVNHELLTRPNISRIFYPRVFHWIPGSCHFIYRSGLNNGYIPKNHIINEEFLSLFARNTPEPRT